MTGFKSIASQKLPHKILAAILEHGHIPHALLFQGIEGVGKEAAAMAFTMACNCTGARKEVLTLAPNSQSEDDSRMAFKLTGDIPCGNCKPCKKIMSGNHPDIFHVRPIGSQIKISQVRNLTHALSLKPYEAKLRTIIIYSAQLLNPAAGNALLKLLEEPPDHTIFILTATQLSDLLPTIVSRCQQIRFRPIPAQDLSEILKTAYQATPDEANRIAVMAGGSLAKAVAMKRSKWVNLRTWMLNELESLSLRPVGSLLAFAEKLTKNKETLLLSIEIILYWLRDLIIIKYCPEKIINQDRSERIQIVSKKNDETDILDIIKHAELIQKKMRTNINIRLTMETLVLRLAKIKVD